MSVKVYENGTFCKTMIRGIKCWRQQRQKRKCGWSCTQPFLSSSRLLSLHCCAAVPESRWLRGQSFQAQHYFSGVQQVMLLLWITFMLLPALLHWLLVRAGRTRHLAPSSVLEASSLSTPCKTDTALSAQLCVSSEQVGCMNILADLKH